MIGLAIAFIVAWMAGGAIILLARLPRGSALLVAAALTTGLAGYAWQGRPGLAGHPADGEAAEAAQFDEALAARRRALGERVSPAGQWLVVSDALGRQGKTRDSANVILVGLRKYPRDADLWVGLGNALVTHGGGTLSPAAEFAYDQADRLAPKSPAPRYFYGLALAQSGQLRPARQVWSGLLATLPPGSGLATELRANLALLAQLQAQADRAGSQ
jgi:cytochrome c-type biogenesis protein CcmH/NrfG